MKILDYLATAVAFLLEQIHNGLATFLPDGSGWAWGLSIVFLTMTVRIILFPLFVKQIKSQRRMQEIAPKVKALQAKHKGDRETLNAELMKLYKDHGTNPVSGCLPLILQLPIFFALFRVMNEFRPHFKDGAPTFKGKYGLSHDLVEQGAHAKVFGAPISAAFNSSAQTLHALGGHASTVKVVAALMVVTMGLTTFLTQRQMMARTGGQLDPQQAQVQKIMLYVLPLSFGVFGFSFPVGVLLYWLTTNVWSMGQQRWVIARMPPVQPGGAGGKGGNGGKGGPGGGDGDGPREPRRPKPSGGGASETPEPPAVSVPEQASSGEGARVPAARPPGSRPGGARAGSRKNKKRKGGRR